MPKIKYYQKLANLLNKLIIIKSDGGDLMEKSEETAKSEKKIEKEIGVITHHYTHLGVAVLKMTSGTLEIGDKIRIKGATTDIEQEIESLQIEHNQVDKVKAGQDVGLKVKDHVREHDKVYKI